MGSVKLRRWLKRLLMTALVLAVVVLIADRQVSWSTIKWCTNDTSDLPKTNVAIVLGTSPRLISGEENLYFKYRIEAAVELYEQGIIKHILVSGDNRTLQYNEPIQMQKALLRKGIPEEDIVLDFAGLRTLDSMVRAKKVFQQDTIIVISQQFHNERATYIARHSDLYAVGYNAKDVPKGFGFLTRVREMLARTKMMLDLYVLGTEPRHLGELETIPED